MTKENNPIIAIQKVVNLIVVNTQIKVCII